MKRITAILTAVALSSLICSCGADTSSSQLAENSSAVTSKAETELSESNEESSAEFTLPEVESCKLEDENFSVYTSNTYLSTGNNGLAKKSDNTTYRAYIPVEEYGELEYCFYFSNTVDSTYSKGNPVYVGKSGEEYTIESAVVYDGGTSTDDELTNKTEVTFNGESSKTVEADEAFWSDSVTIDIPEGHYLVWEWTLTGKSIPCNKMSDLTSTTSSSDGEEFTYCSDIPLPVFIGAKRESVTNRIVAIGDSITQGCQTDYMEFEYWSAEIAKQLGDNASLWNCGLGWARTSDLATCGNWLGRALNCDTAIVAFGTNDIISGEYGGDGGNTAEEIIDYLTPIIAQLKVAGVENIIVFNAPPQDYDEDLEAVRTEYNETLKQVTESFGVEYFDFASLLCDSETPSVAKYGGHPTGEAGKLVADAFIEQFGDIIGG